MKQYQGYTISEIDALASKLGGVGELPTTYLGMSLGAKSKSATIWNGVVEKCTNRLTNWKSQHLSMGGKLKTHWSSYLMSIFPMPASVIKKIDVLIRNFVWQGNEDKKKYHLVKWEELLVNKKAGR